MVLVVGYSKLTIGKKKRRVLDNNNKSSIGEWGDRGYGKINHKPCAFKVMEDKKVTTHKTYLLSLAIVPIKVIAL